MIGPYLKGDLQLFANATTQSTGERSACDRGSHKPFVYLGWFQDDLRHNSLYRPWLLQGEDSALEQSDPVKPEGVSTFNSFAYRWSLESVFNRRNYNRFQLRSEGATKELKDYYLANYDVDEITAENWSRFFISSWYASIFDLNIIAENNKKAPRKYSKRHCWYG